MQKDPLNAGLSVADRMGIALKHAGVSVTVTSLTDVFAFGVGAVTVS
jgi:Niemann-Pick C1 protein